MPKGGALCANKSDDISDKYKQKIKGTHVNLMALVKQGRNSKRVRFFLNLEGLYKYIMDTGKFLSKENAYNGGSMHLLLRVVVEFTPGPKLTAIFTREIKTNIGTGACLVTKLTRASSRAISCSISLTSSGG